MEYVKYRGYTIEIDHEETAPDPRDLGANDKEEIKSYLSGDVFCFHIGGMDIDESSGGYYNKDHEKSGLLDEARCYIDRIIKDSQMA